MAELFSAAQLCNDLTMCEFVSRQIQSHWLGTLHLFEYEVVGMFSTKRACPVMAKTLQDNPTVELATLDA
eukprot:CAMPEP_0175890100 /NCGR_PEP_ID=MMETSP0107_2-20121207/47637_1 /TAXON_ID=195067 ORGANISM="Goniomonas pacifica, Strain CCMP1869" /NCGR_SAMPLE_ID=MMETSP0107_2 /ASSEMBLY_ACC=CAM_ASM_000203 /LENGTH=69 /DNA_ID=CAMNT_0017210821 /DNA_START=88 /DNA_END=298 /DNA_ORIENTATION=+